MSAGIISPETEQQGAEAQRNALMQRTAERNAFDAANPANVAQSGPLSYVPSLSGLGRMVGQAVATAPAAVPAGAAMGALAPGAAVAGRAAPYINALLQGASGGAVGAGLASSASDAPVLQQMGTGTAGGAILGPAGLAVTNAARSGTNALIERLSPTARAANQIEAGLSASGQTASDVASRLQSNPRLNLADADPSLLATGQGLVREGGQPRTTIDQAIGTRQASRTGEARDILNRTLGTAPDPVAVREALAQRAQQNAAQGFGDALRNAGAVDLSKALAHIDGQMPRVAAGITPSPRVTRLQEIRASLADEQGNVLVSPQRLHEIQSELGREARTLRQSSVGSERQMAQQIEATRQQIVQAIDDASGGKYRPAQRQFAQDLEIREAFEEGRNAFRTGRDQHPSEIRADLAALPQAAQQAYRAGALVHLNDIMGQTRNASRTGAAIPESQFGRDKLEILFGKKQADEISRLFGDEQAMMRTNNALVGGSQTALREGAADRVRVRDVPSLGNSVGIGALPPIAGAGGLYFGAGPEFLGAAAAGTAVGLANMARQAFGRRLDIRTNNRLAEMLTSSGPRRDEVINLLLQRSAPRQIQESVNPLLGAGVSNALALPLQQRPLVPQP
jgi:hypothetical protein